MLDPHTGRVAWLPFEHLLDQLTRKGFRIGVEHCVRLQMLLDRVGDQCSPSDLKTLLCPLFATNAHQQESFYRVFDACYPFLLAGGGESRSTAETATHTLTTERLERRARGARQRWLAVVAAVVIALAAFTGIALWRVNNDDVARIAATSSERPVPPAVPAIPPITSESPWRAWYSARRSELGWIAVGGPFVAWLLWELHRSYRRHLLIRKSLDKALPYSWPVRADATPEIYEPSQLASVNRLLHRRYYGESERLDVMATVTASIASLGFPTFRYRRDSQLPDYLFLIDSAGRRDHQSHLYEHLAGMLRAQGLYVTTWFFDDDPRVCWNAAHDGSVYLAELARTCSGHRLLLFGTASGLLDAVSGRLAEWRQVFESWTERAILTPNPPSDWGANELALASQFVVVPATLDGLTRLTAYFDRSVSPGQVLAGEVGMPRLPATAEVSALREYLGLDVFQWLCACAIYPELQWGLTLTLGTLPSMPPGLVCEGNLMKLLRLEWFQAGSIPDDQRLELIAQLAPSVERDVRETIVRVLEDSPVPDEMVAASAHHFQIAYQRASLQPKDRKARANLRAALDDLSTHETIREHAYLDVSESKPLSALDLVLPQTLRKMFYPAGPPWMPVRVLSGLAMAFLVVVAGLGGLRLADRWVSPGDQLLTITKPAGGTIVGPGIECGSGGSRCSTNIRTGELTELYTRPDKGYVFSGYTGDCAPVGRTSMTGSRTCGATFDRVGAPAATATFRLTIAKPSGGTIVGAGGILCGTNGSSCVADIPSGAPVKLLAEPDQGYSSRQFTGDCPSSGELTMTSAKTCGIAFVPGSESTQIASGPAPNATAPPAPGEAAKAAMSAEDHAKQEIAQLVDNYCASLETLNPAITSRLFHLDNQREIADRFREYKSLKCTVTTPADYDRIDASAAGGAQLKVGMKQVVAMRSGGPGSDLQTVVTMTVSRKDFQSPWLIDRVSHEVTAAVSTASPAGGASPVATADRAALPISPAQGGLEVFQGETDKAYKARVAAMSKKYDDAVAVLASQNYQQALAMLDEIMGEVPNRYRDLAQRRDEARAGMRAQARTALDGAEAAEKSNNYDAAIELYHRAHQLDPSIEVESRIQRIDDRKVQLGRMRCNEGLMELAYGKTADAIAAFEAAITLLPPTDPCYSKAKDALRRIAK